MFFHGTPGSRLTLSAEDPIVQALGARIVLPDRPGYGISDAKPERTLADWPADVLELADHLGHDSFAVAGESGGGPHALACAALSPQRVTMALLLSSPSPANFRGATKGMSFGNRIGLLLNRYAPWLVRRMIRSGASTFQKNPQRFLDAVLSQMAAPDRELLNKKSFRDAMERDFAEAYRQGAEGHVDDGQLTLTSGNWGFNLSAISVPVYLWYGEADTLVTRNMTEHLREQIPRSVCYFVPAAGHLLTEHPDVLRQMRAALAGEPESA